MASAAARVFISGRVQGVWYRAATRDEAQRLGLTGWVRNLADGRVEALFEGARPAIEQAVAWCHQGPPHADVDAVDVQWIEAEGHAAFRVRHSS